MFYEIRETEDTALISSSGVSLTYAELGAGVRRLGEHIEGRKLAFSLCENSPASVVGYLAFLNRKTVPLLLDRKIDRALLEHLLDVYRPDYIYAPSEMAAQFDGYKAGAVYENYTLLGNLKEEETVLDDELALLLTTSGSTGSPKLVRQSYRNIESNAEAIAEYLELDSTERPVTTLPMNYTYGLSIINSHLLVGATILMTDQPMNMKAFWTFMKGQKATSFGGVPFTYEMLKKVRFFKMDLPDLRYMTQAGGKLSPELHREFAQWCADRGKKFIVMYGQTEATARMGYLPASKSLEKYGSMGIPIPGGKYILIDEKGQSITTPEVTGELVYEGPNVTLGYSETREDLAKGDERHGRLVTGDMAKFDSDGYYYITGRKKRFLKIYGNRVNLDEIDRMMKQEFGGMDCVSTGVDDHMMIYITSEDKKEEVKRWLSEKTHLSETAFGVSIVEKIPRNESGKVLYKKLKEM